MGHPFGTKQHAEPGHRHSATSPVEGSVATVENSVPGGEGDDAAGPAAIETCGDCRASCLFAPDSASGGPAGWPLAARAAVAFLLPCLVLIAATWGLAPRIGELAACGLGGLACLLLAASVRWWESVWSDRPPCRGESMFPEESDVQDRLRNP